MSAELKTKPVMLSLEIPADPQLLQAAGRVALAHGQLEHVLRMTVKTLTGLAVHAALKKTAKMTAFRLRTEVRELFGEKSSDESAKRKLDAILRKAEALTQERNCLIHRPWTKNPQGRWVVKEENHAWGKPPSIPALNRLAEEIFRTTIELNTARLTGFIQKAISGPTK